jgi:hypothetical protein
MKLTEALIGKDGKTIEPYLRNTKIAELVEISTSSEITKKLEDIRKAMSRNSSASYLVIALRV